MTEPGQQIGQRGQALYDQTLKAQVEEGNLGKFLILDVSTGDYEIDPEDLNASKQLLKRRPDAVLFGVRIGHRAAYRMVGVKEALLPLLN